MNPFSEIRNAQGERIDASYHEAEKNQTLVILGHGVTGNKDRPLLIAIAEGLAARGWPCLRISYSGNGDSEGSFADCTITKEIADLQSVLDAVPAETKIAYCGHSMGGAVGVLTAVRDERIACLITLAGMVMTRDFCQREFGDVVPDQGNMWDDESCPLSQAYVDDLHRHESTLAAAEAMMVPWLLVHGSDDDVVPISDSEAAFAVAPQPKEFLRIEGEGHSFSDASYSQVVDAIAAWLQAHHGV
jgi:pimeloyl-ACP methyl ester carboxylesterase